jgi:hypothetical protein
MGFSPEDAVVTRMRRGSRGGYSLIEVVLVVGAVSIVIGLCGTLLHGLLRLDRAGRSFVSDTSVMARLAHQFRDDVRSAGAVKSTATGAAIELTLADDMVVQYQVEGGRLLRLERRKETEKRRESYAVERLGPVAFVASGRTVGLILGRHPSGARGPDRPEVRIVARLGKDRELAGADLAEAKK